MADDFRPDPPAGLAFEDRLTSAEFALMAHRGAFEGLGRFELRAGKLHRMRPVHHPHARLAARILAALFGALDAGAPDLEISGETTLGFDDGFSPTADIVVCEGRFEGFVPGHAARLIIEVAQSSLADDLGDKAISYARGGLAEYWVADVQARVIHQHWAPSATGFAQRRVIRFGEPAVSVTLEGVTVRTDRLG
jgi:Uma2 family endonuclease